MENNVAASMDLPEGIRKLNLTEGLVFPRLQAPLFSRAKQGGFVAVRPAKDSKTYLGIYLGDLGIMVGGTRDGNDLTLARSYGNPCIFVPALNNLVYGCESWWGVIKSPEHLREITDNDISDVWYVQALKAMVEEDTAEEPAE